MSAFIARTSRTSTRIIEGSILNSSFSSRRFSTFTFNQTRCIQTPKLANKCLLYNVSTQDRRTSAPLLTFSRQMATTRRITSVTSISTAIAKAKSSNKPSSSRSFTSSAPVLAKKKVKKYKLKTNHAAAQRWKAISNAMFKRRRAGRSHFMVKKSSKRANSLGKDVLAAPYHVRALKRLLPYA